MPIKEYILEILKTFENDPPDTDYQDGYKAAFEEMLKYINAKPQLKSN